jgi:hypothetical protein
VTKQSWDLLERIGNGDLNENAFLLPYTTAKIVAHIPMEKQKAIFESKGVKFYNPRTKTEKTVSLQELSASQASLVIDVENGKIRSVEEQKQAVHGDCFVDARASRKAPYVIQGAICIINGVSFGKETIRKILNEMEGENQ